MSGVVHNKDVFLDKIAKSLGRNRKTTEIVRPKWKHQPQWDVFKGMSQDELLTELIAQCEKIHTKVERTSSSNLNNTLANVISNYKAKSIISWDDRRFSEYGITAYYEQAKENGIDVHVWDTNRGDENIAIAEKADVGITFSDMTLAESGTVVLFSDNGKGRAVSLLPTYYVAIIPKSSIVPRMTQATKRIHEMAEEGNVPSCVNFISGPSNSADIEMNLVVGVHGPVKATYIIVEDK